LATSLQFYYEIEFFFGKDLFFVQKPCGKNQKILLKCLASSTHASNSQKNLFNRLLMFLHHEENTDDDFLIASIKLTAILGDEFSKATRSALGIAC